MTSWRRRLRRRTRPVRHWLRRVRYSRHTRPVRRVVLYGGGALVVLGLAWLVITGLLARSQLSHLEHRLAEVRTLVAQGRIDDARTAAAGIPDLGRKAHELTTGPAWWVAAHVPYLGDPLDVTRGTTVATERISTQAVPQLIRAAALIDPAKLRASGNTVRLAPLVRAAPELQAAARTIDATTTSLAGLPGSTWLSAVDNERTVLRVQLEAIRGYVDAAARTAKVLPTMLGGDGTKRYFIGLQNEAESRGTGGLPGAFAIARVHAGTLTFERFESDAALEPPGHNHVIDTGLDLGPSYDALYGPAQPTREFVNSNVSPHFPYAARIWAAMWEKVSGQHVDGVVAVDPTALSYFLLATGPTPLPGGGTLDAAHVVSLTQRDNYVLFPDNTQRKQFLVSVLRAASQRLTSGAGTAFGLVQAASRAAAQRRLLVWSSDPQVERLLAQTTYAGALPPADRPLSAPILNNAAGGKIDYYVSRTLSYSRSGCGARRDVVATITLRNDAPAAGLPPYVVGRADRPPPDAKPGDTHERLDYYATAGALLDSVTLNGSPTTASAQTTLGHAVFRLDVQLPRGTTQTIVLHLDEPAGRGAPLIWSQPGVTPLAVRVAAQTC